jgi:hypothetical protein
MLYISSSNASAPSSELVDVPAKKDEDNIAWGVRTMKGDTGVRIAMVGGVSQTSFRLRTAQSQIRHDLQPSHWSHVMLVGKLAKNLAATPVYEISLESVRGFGFPPPTNGVQQGRLGQYRDPEAYPNIAILSVPVSQDEVMTALERFKMQRTVLDAVDLLVRWLGYVWGVGATGNPLLENRGIPSAAMLEVVFGAVGYDLTPGTESRSSCPEAIWQAAKWWHEYYEKQGRPSLKGVCCVRHKL